MQFEEFDKKAQEAASHHHPAYDEKAWGKMEKLLDQHLPGQENKRRRFFFLLLLLLCLGTAGILLLQPRSEKQAPSVAFTQEAGPSPRVSSGKEQTNKLPEQVPSGFTLSRETDPGKERVVPALTGKNNPSGKQGVATPGEGLSGKPSVLNTEMAGKDAVISGKIQKDNKTTGQEFSKPVEPGIINPVRDTAAGLLTATEPQQAPENKGNHEIKNRDPGTTGNQEKETSLPQVKEKPAAMKSQPLKQSSHFFFGASAGPDVSFTAGGKPGVTRISGGIGIGFTYKDRFTLRTGIYEGRKIYKSSPEAYNAPAIFYVYYPYLERIWANCRIREIPVNLSYHFGHSSRRDMFVTAGLSSLFMKEEVYDYTYKRTANGPLLHRRWSVIDQGKHLFSVLTVGAGYRRAVGKGVTVLAEPYLKIPLSGVGYGKVKLYSSGISFSVTVNPFVAKPSK